MTTAAHTELYEKLHANNDEYHERNQGVDCFDMWIDELEVSSSIIEIGCGNGLLCKKLADVKFLDLKITGVDLVDGPYDRDGYEFKIADAVTLLGNFELNQFDYALCFDVLEHLDENDVVFALKQITQVAPNIIMSMACYGGPPLHLTVHSPGWWLDKLLWCCPLMDWSVLKVFERYPGYPVILVKGTEERKK